MARDDHPTGLEIAQQAKQLRLDQSKGVSATRAKDNLHVRFTPALFDPPKKKDEVEQGVVLGEGDVTLGRLQTDLRPGKYHPFLAKVGDSWNGYAEFNGDIARHASRVTVREESAPRDISDNVPKIEFGSICLKFCIIVVITIPPIEPFEIPIPIVEISVPLCWEVCFSI